MAIIISPCKSNSDCPLHNKHVTGLDAGIGISVMFGSYLLNIIAAHLLYPTLQSNVSFAYTPLPVIGSNVGSMAIITWVVLDKIMHSIHDRFDNCNQKNLHIIVKLIANLAITYFSLLGQSQLFKFGLSFPMKAALVLLPNALALLAETFYFHRKNCCGKNS